MPSSRRRPRLGPLLASVSLGTAAAWLAYSHLGLHRHRRLPPALPGRQERLASTAGDLAFYASDAAEGVPLLLIHSVNAAANAYEVRPLYRHYAGSRPVYALDLPGFGFSERRDRVYTPGLMTAAIHALAAEIRRRHGGARIDAMALSLSAEFLARAALERPDDYRSLGLVSPTGFDRRYERDDPRGSDAARAAVAFPLWGRPLFDLLVSRPSMRFFLEKTWGSTAIDEGLLAYDQLSAHQPGAEHAPFSFLAGHLFATATGRIYPRLALPVWMVHGTRGDFVDYCHAERFRDAPNWTIDVMETGAFPHFERLSEVTARYDAFLARVPA
ncbi:alpha/beta fold hydrolase [Methylobacterium sp. J-068]|uniref:alpha/beta fold hydrolase n=1 Tax=Methylobacterium sp. J-068 TaxID=2836649 RepID=UPI001FB9E155|nr:alpha/beta hydrolase [Methylobacterium sp. J-068]MCJ2034872.1 alpha/beta hydrolase [Methylobacterium sp. J-068]